MNPFDDLERQLRSSVRTRRSRSRVLRRGVVLAGAGALLTGAGATAALIAGGGKEEPLDSRLLRAALRATFSERECRPSSEPLRLVPDAPASETLRAFGVFRRPQRPDERLPDRWLGSRGAGSGGEVLEPSIRVIRRGDRTLTVFISRGAGLRTLFPRDPEACSRSRHRAIDRIGARMDPDDVRGAHAALERHEAQERARTQDREDRLFLFTFAKNGSGGGGGGGTPAEVAATGMGGWSLAREGGRRFRVFHGLVPDGVAAIEARMTYRGRPYRRTARVRDNVYAFRVPFRGGVRLIWRDRDGRHVPRG